MMDDDNGEPTMTKCPICGNEQPYEGQPENCEDCGIGPMPIPAWERLAERDALAARVRALEAALQDVLSGVDDYWATLPCGKAALAAAELALREEP